MEAPKQSSSSFTSELFGPKDSSSSSSSSSILTSMFVPPAKAAGGEPLKLSEHEKNNGSTAKAPVHGDEDKKWSKSWYYGEEKVEPFHYNSSIYYGGQDVYSQPQNTPNTTIVDKDISDHESGSASRGDWWQGSLYY